jgi:glycyl-tRNA synthetase
MRLKIPFGIAQIGKAFRNEITPKDFIFRMREFEQMEMQWFCLPEKTEEFFEYWKEQRVNWYYNLGIKKENLRINETEKKDLAHYAKRAVDIEYKFPFGWKELEGIHNRGEWDLSNHAKNSGENLSWKNEENKDYYPNIIETSVGVDRSFLAFLCDAYHEVEGGRTETTKSAKDMETVLKLNKALAPVKVAVFPLVKNKPEIVQMARDIFESLRKDFVCQYDETDSIGRRYRRQDEIGTLYCLTVDFDSIENHDVTIRDRDTMKQERISIEKITDYLNLK